MLQRRTLLGAGMAGATALTLSSVWSQGSPNFGTATLPAPGFRRMKVGALEVIAVLDGITRRPLGEEFVTNAPLEQVKALLASQGLPTDYIDVPYTPFVVAAGGQRMLFDTGFADNGPANTGKLLEHLGHAGIKAEDIDAVVISHFHGDHLSGVRNKAGALVFPKAKVYVPDPEFAFWMDDARMNAAPPAMKGAFMNVRRVLASMPAERLLRFTPGTEVLPGLNSVAAFGHTPGHTLFTLKSEGQAFAYLADLTNVPSLFARAPEWSVVFDMNPEMARATRRRMFDMVVNEKMIAGGFHFPFPAFGRVEVAGNGYQFRPQG